MRVEELLEEPELALHVRVRGTMDRRIRWVHTIDIPEPGPFLRGGEVVLTAGVWRATGSTAEKFVADLVKADVAALGFGIVPPETDIPEELLDAARAHQLTCFSVPAEVPFLRIVEAFIAHRRAEWERPLRRHLSQHDAIVTALRHRRGAATVLQVLSQQLNGPVALQVNRGLLEGTRPDPAHRLSLASVGLGDAELLLPSPVEELDTAAHASVIQAMPFIALEIQRDRAVRATEIRYAGELFEWVHSAAVPPDTVRTRLAALDLPPDGPLAAVVVRSADPDADAVCLGEFLGSDGVAVRRGNETVGFARVTGAETDLARRVHAAVADRVAQVGVGKPGAAEGLRVSMLQAKHAAEAARSTGGWMTHEQLSSPALLLAVQDPELLAATSTALLRPVLDQDERRGGELIASLAVFLDAGGRWQEAAQRLHVHINTLRHRMHRVEELTGRSLSSTADRVDLYLALRALGQA